MIISIRLQHFRSYHDESFELNPSVNIIVGPNASGKTNLLEAVLVVARGSSYRAKDTELIEFGEDWGRLDAHTEDGERIVKLTTQPSKSYELDGKPFKRLLQPHTMPTVLFEPGHLGLLTGSPEGRRTYLDDLLEQTTPGYGSLRRQYRRALAQRNALLKRPEAAAAHFFAWDVRLSELGGHIVRARLGLVDVIAAKLPDLYKEISRSPTTVDAVYHASFAPESYETAMLKKLSASHTLDRQRGFTSTGPHREDFGVLFDRRAAAEVASRGEVRTAVLGFKIMELAILEEVREQKPLLLLDDVFSELDGARRHALTDYLQPYQTFITTTDADIVLHHFTDQCNVIPLST